MELIIIPFKEDASGLPTGSEITMGTDNITETAEVKQDGSIVTHKGDVVQEQVPIDRVPEKLFGNVRQQDVPEIAKSVIDKSVVIGAVYDDEVLSEKPEPEGVSEDYDEEEQEHTEMEEEDSWDPEQSKTNMMDWAKGKDGKISKKSLMKWYLDVDAGNGQDPNAYRYPVGAVVNGKPYYCRKALDHSWNLASGNQTGIANRNIQKKIIFLKNREDMPLTEDQMDFTERHMEAFKENSNCPASEKNGVGPGSCGGSKGKQYDNPTVKWTEPSFSRDNRPKIDLSRGMQLTNQNKVISMDIKSPISVWTKTGETKPSRAYYGNSNILSSKLEKLRLETGDQLHQLPSGLFAVKKSGEVREVSVYEPIHDVDDTELKHWDKSVSKKFFDVSKNPYKTDYNKSTSRMKRNETFLEDEHSPGGLDIVMTDNIKMNSSPAGSKIIYEDDQVIDVPVVPMREGVFTGTDGIPTLKKFEYFGKDAHWLEGQPILKGHTAPTELVTYKHNRIGKLMNVTARPDKKDVVAVARYYKDKITPEDLSRIKSGIPYDGSIAYTTHTSMTKGDLNGTKYNAVEDGGYHFYHFAELADGIGACSTKDGCGFMLNEAGVPAKEDDIIKSYYNDKRRADLIRTNDNFEIKLNASNGGNGTLLTDDLDTAVEWSKTYVKSGKIPVSMKLNYNCPESEKSGTGPGSCGGSRDKDSKSNKKLPEKRTVMIPRDKSGKKYKADFVPERKFKKIISHGNVLTEETNPKTGDVTYRGMNNKTATVSKLPNGKWKVTAGTVFEDEEREIYNNETEAGLAARRFAAGKGIKRNETFLEDENLLGSIDIVMSDEIKMNSSNLGYGNNMTEEFIQADDTEVVDVQKMNEAFEQKLNERDAKITELTAQVADLVQKQNAAEQALIDAKAQADFEAFTLKLNAKAREDAKTHYEGFKSDGWTYFDTNPGLLRAETPKMNARGQPAAEGDNGSNLQAARDMLKKNQKELFGKRTH